MTTPTYTPHRVRLVGHRDLGTVRARWVGCILELEDGTRYGPVALFAVVPVAEPVKRPPPGWSISVNWAADLANAMAADLAADLPDAMAWAWTVTGNDGKPHAMSHTPTPAAPPVQEPAPEPKPAAVLLRGWKQPNAGEPTWYLYSTGGLVLAGVHGARWWADNQSGPETGLRGKECAAFHLLNNGAEWVGLDEQSASFNHDTRAIRRFRADDVAVMVDGTRRTVVGSIDSWLLFTDGTWLTHDAAETAIAARVPADDGVPF
jgi:hypothetical protein